MSLHDHFQPMDPPANGLRSVQRRARRRAVQRKLVSGSPLVVIPFVLFLGIAAVNENAEVDGSQDASTATVTTVQRPSGVTEIGTISPDPAGLPGSSVAVQRTTSAWFTMLVGLLIVVVTLAGSIMRTLRSTTPASRFTRTAKVFLVIGVTAPLWLYFLMNWFFGSDATVG
jgi:anti-sigma factor RsiW